MPRVTIHLYATFRRYADGKPAVEVDIQTGQTVRETIEALGIPLDQTRIVFVDNRAIELDHVLRGGERVGVFPAIGGG
jgi:sulfur carrier protein ThiS